MENTKKLLPKGWKLNSDLATEYGIPADAINSLRRFKDIEKARLNGVLIVKVTPELIKKIKEYKIYRKEKKEKAKKKKVFKNKGYYSFDWVKQGPWGWTLKN